MNDRSCVSPLRPFGWDEHGLWYIDCRQLPAIIQQRANDSRAVVDAITSGAISGPRSIALYAAFGVVVARHHATSALASGVDIEHLSQTIEARGASTAALQRVASAPVGHELAEASTAYDENRAIDDAIATQVQALLPVRGSVLTLGGTGALSTGGEGTVVRALSGATRAGQRVHAYVAETRPGLLGQRLTATELARAGVPATVIPDAAAAALMQTQPITAVIAGAHTLAANGDAIGDVGTYAIALAAAHHRIPFYLAVPRATIDGSRLRAAQIAALPMTGHNGPLLTASIEPTNEDDRLGPCLRFDVTPAHLISAIVTEYGITRPPYFESLPVLASRPNFASILRLADPRH